MKNLDSPIPEFMDGLTLSCAFLQIQSSPWDKPAHELLQLGLHLAILRHELPALILQSYLTWIEINARFCPDPLLHLTLEWILGLQKISTGATLDVFLPGYANLLFRLGQIWQSHSEIQLSKSSYIKNMTHAWHGMPKESPFWTTIESKNLKWPSHLRVMLMPKARFCAREIINNGASEKNQIFNIQDVFFKRPFSYFSKKFRAGFIFAHQFEDLNIFEAAVLAHEAEHLHQLRQKWHEGQQGDPNCGLSNGQKESSALKVEFQFLMDHSEGKAKKVATHNFFVTHFSRQATIFEIEKMFFEQAKKPNNNLKEYYNLCEQRGFNASSFAPADFFAFPLYSSCYLFAGLELLQNGGMDWPLKD